MSRFDFDPSEFLSEINDQVASNCSNFDFDPVRTIEGGPHVVTQAFILIHWLPHP